MQSKGAMPPEPETTAPAPSPWKAFVVNLTLVVLACVSALYAGIAVNSERAVEAGLRTRAQALVNAIVLARSWNASHGGVWVEKTPGTASNPFLGAPDLDARDGRTYTLKNPAAMAREISELSEKGGLFRFHLRSLRPKNPANTPDAFEARALADFERGVTDAAAREERDGGTFYRYMAPVYMEKSCLRCHESEGYSVGDVHGGISVAFDIGPVLHSVSRNRRITAGAFLLTALALAAIIWRLVVVLRRRLALAEERIRELATTDDLTGLRNRRYVTERLADELARARRYRDPLSCVLFDVDRFKVVNDTFGHDAGDAVLQAVSAAARAECRQPDVLGRWGGEEFLLVLPRTDAHGAFAIAARLRDVLESLRVAHAGRTISTTASFGVTTVAPGTIEDLETVLKRADRALYRAKDAGRNRVEMAA
jgi:diguanylate cyclase (GGDEF)-like protein